MLTLSGPKVSLLVLIFIGISTFAFAQAGSLDPTFGHGGIVTINFGQVGNNGSATVGGVAIQSDGKIVVGGGIPDGNGHGLSSFFVARFLSNGTLDKTFGNNGISAMPGSGGSYTSVLIQPDGKILAGGGQVARYTAKGALDNSFGTKGIVTIGGIILPNAVTLALQESNIIVGGNGEGGLFGFVTRLLPDGAVDPSFGTGQPTPGVTEISVLGSVNRLAMLANGDILALGNQGGPSVVALTSAGLPDTNFGLNAQLATAAGPNGMAIGSNGDILVTGTLYTDPTSPTTLGFALAAYQSIGVADPSFAKNGGTITALPNASSVKAVGLGVEPNGDIVVVGTAGLSGQTDFALARYTPSGQLDGSFGNNGTVETPFVGSTPTANGVAIQPDSKIIVFGALTTVEGGALDTQLLLTRYLAK